MSVLQSQLNPRSADFQANAAAMRTLVDDLRLHLEKVALGGGETARARHTARGKLLPRERVHMLLDPGTPFLELAPLAALNLYHNDAPSAGLIAGTVPTIGTSKTSRTIPSAMVEAVLQAMQTSLGRRRSVIRPSSPATRAAICASLLSP